MWAETYPLRVLLLTISGFVNRHQADIIAYLVEENRVLKEHMKGPRVEPGERHPVNRSPLGGGEQESIWAGSHPVRHGPPFS